MTGSASHDVYGPQDARRDLGDLTSSSPMKDAEEAGQRLTLYLDHLEALKSAADEMVYQSLHPKRKGREMLNSVVAYRRLSEGYGE